MTTSPTSTFDPSNLAPAGPLVPPLRPVNTPRPETPIASPLRPSPTERNELAAVMVAPEDLPAQRQMPDDVQYLARLDESLDRAERLLDELTGPAIDTLVSIVMPVYNEARTIETVVSRVLSLRMPVDLIVVDDGSTDGTPRILEQLAAQHGFRLIRHERNQGKGAALRTGFAAARGEIIAVQDADLEYDPAELPVLVKPIVLGCCDVVYGSRYLAPVSDDPSRLHRWGNGALTRLSNLLTRQNLTDMETCYKVMRRSALAGITLKQDRFGIEPELTAKLARRGVRIYEMPVTYAGRSYAEGKKIGIKDGLNALWCIVRYGLAD